MQLSWICEFGVLAFKTMTLGESNAGAKGWMSVGREKYSAEPNPDPGSVKRWKDDQGQAGEMEKELPGRQRCGECGTQEPSEGSVSRRRTKCRSNEIRLSSNHWRSL